MIIITVWFNLWWYSFGCLLTNKYWLHRQVQVKQTSSCNSRLTNFFPLLFQERFKKLLKEATAKKTLCEVSSGHKPQWKVKHVFSWWLLLKIVFFSHQSKAMNDKLINWHIRWTRYFINQQQNSLLTLFLSLQFIFIIVLFHSQVAQTVIRGDYAQTNEGSKQGKCWTGQRNKSMNREKSFMIYLQRNFME